MKTPISATSAADMDQCRLWTHAFLADPSALPVTFQFDGKPVRGIPADWNPTAAKSQLNDSILQTVYAGKEPQTGLALKIECLEYRDFPVVEWTAWLSNPTDQPTPIVSDLQALDAAFAGSSPVVVHCNGDFYNQSGYTPEETPLPAGSKQVYAPFGGRACDQAFPYYRLLFDGCGLTLAIGWPGQWSARFDGTPSGAAIRAGQEKTFTRLLPGETLRSPRITLMAWVGSTERAVNLWRRWYLRHVLPRPNGDGQPLRPALALASSDVGEEFTAATEQNQLAYMDRFAANRFEFDVWWIDAGWYPCKNEKGERRWWNTGHWIPDPERFPNGFKPIAENAARYGARLLIWFEPERVTAGSWMEVNHPEWILKTVDKVNRLLNLGNPDCRAWLTEHVNRVIQENGIGIYRQDFNFEPILFWRDNEAEDRQGINENLHVQGYLQYWDDILRANPGLWIDSCSSGGRRNDMETMRRSVPLHYTDFGYGNHPVKLAFHHTLYQWIPYFKECTLSWDLDKPENVPPEDRCVDDFSFHCGFGPMLFPIINIRSSTYDHAPEVAMTRVWRKVADLLTYGDYYPLTPFSKAPDRWVARQFDRPETGEGMFQAIRLPGCPAESYTAFLQDIDPARDYLFHNPASGEKRLVSGSALTTAGFQVELPARAGVIWKYRLK